MSFILQVLFYKLRLIFHVCLRFLPLLWVASVCGPTKTAGCLSNCFCSWERNYIICLGSWQLTAYSSPPLPNIKMFTFKPGIVGQAMFSVFKIKANPNFPAPPQQMTRKVRFPNISGWCLFLVSVGLLNYPQLLLTRSFPSHTLAATCPLIQSSNHRMNNF